MAIQSSGPISFSDLAAEFGDTKPYSFSEFYRDGGKVPGVNASVAASGAIRLGTFYGSVNELLQTVTSSASINAQTIFGSDWGTNIPKRLSIPSGVNIGPLTIPSGMGGTLEVDVAGNIYGSGGASNSGSGGHAITSNSSFTLNVLSGGSVRAGGGGGGKGGTGGSGSYSESQTRDYSGNQYRKSGNSWTGSWDYQEFGGMPANRGGWYYTAGNRNGGNDDTQVYSINRSRTVSTTGGAGGNGGVGQGYNQSASSGAGGSAGGTNAGAGGTGGSGGGYATAGSSGSAGASGNAGGGSAGSGGGAAGRAVQMNAGTVTVNNSGTINGAY